MRKILYLIIAFLFCAECDNDGNKWYLKIKEVCDNKSKKYTSSHIYVYKEWQADEYIGNVRDLANHLYNHGHILDEDTYNYIHDASNQREKFDQIVGSRLDSKKKSLELKKKKIEEFIKKDTDKVRIENCKSMVEDITRMILSIEKEKMDCKKRGNVTFFVANGGKENVAKHILKNAQILQKDARSIIIQVIAKKFTSHSISTQINDWHISQPKVKIILGSNNIIKTVFVETF